MKKLLFAVLFLSACSSHSGSYLESGSITLELAVNKEMAPLIGYLPQQFEDSGTIVIDGQVEGKAKFSPLFGYFQNPFLDSGTISLPVTSLY